MNQQNVGRYIRRLREERMLSMAQLSRICGLSADHIGRIERGEVTNVTLHSLERIAGALEVSLTKLLKSPAKKSPKKKSIKKSMKRSS